jgi:hypothetical protein
VRFRISEMNGFGGSSLIAVEDFFLVVVDVAIIFVSTYSVYNI